MDKYPLFETLNHQDIDAVKIAKEKLINYMEKYFSCTRLLTLLCLIDVETCEKTERIVKDVAEHSFYSLFDTVCEFNTLKTTELMQYIDDLEDEYDNLKFQWDKVFEYNIAENKVTILNYIGEEQKVIVPKRIKGYPVAEIADNCFRNSHVLIEADIEADIEEIPSHCFYFCNNLKKIVLSDTVKKIGSCAFCACDDLEEIQLGQQIEYIDFMAFYECKKLRDITLPNTIRHIYQGAFNKCKNIEKLVIPANVEYIGYDSSMQTFSKHTIILCEHGSVAEEYATKYGYQIEYTN